MPDSDEGIGLEWLPIPKLRDEKTERDLAHLECRLTSLAKLVKQRRSAETQYLAAMGHAWVPPDLSPVPSASIQQSSIGHYQSQSHDRSPSKEHQKSNSYGHSPAEYALQRIRVQHDAADDVRKNAHVMPGASAVCDFSSVKLPPSPSMLQLKPPAQCSMVLPQSLPGIPKDTQLQLIHLGYVYLPGMLPPPPQLPDVPQSNVVFNTATRQLSNPFYTLIDMPKPSPVIHWIPSLPPPPLSYQQMAPAKKNQRRPKSAAIGASSECNEIDLALENFRKKQKPPWKFIRVAHGKYLYGGVVLDIAMIGRKLKARHESFNGGRFKSLHKFVVLFDPTTQTGFSGGQKSP
eukprot:gnl/MRDRNA2_/MRDRNA2_148209_c0_seq1.p1 gnl/MRDRNA2_/MRDRNA2_148209_c0~~gnl/MRDRNA2_/MRDRNA2_148209_c0_seq1.p1  ORF type:complete len:347 (-),score=57.04 gnl/MRDRNA2_/MRDRNA2_148209_c0_seq1:44-1084(-)